MSEKKKYSRGTGYKKNPADKGDKKNPLMSTPSSKKKYSRGTGYKKNPADKGDKKNPLMSTPSSKKKYSRGTGYSNNPADTLIEKTRLMSTPSSKKKYSRGTGYKKNPADKGDKKTPLMSTPSSKKKYSRGTSYTKNPANAYVEIPDGNTSYPIIGHYFEVKITISSGTYNCAFQSVNGLSKTTKTKKIQDGGDNISEYHLPSHYTYKDITLKRGMIRGTNNDIYPARIKEWFENLGWNSSGSMIDTASIVISIKDFDSNKNVLDREVITLYNAYPTSVTLGELNSEKSAILVETINIGFSKYESRRAELLI